MAQELQTADFERQNQNLKLGILGIFFAGLFLLAIGAGFFLFKGANSEDLQIISGENTQSNQEIMVHIDGAVNNPGVYSLASNARVGDAVTLAGGLSSQADTTRINLAAKLTDGQKINILSLGDPVSRLDAGQSVSQFVNINDASQAQLESLPGIGPVTAQKIIASRPYSSSEDLLTRKVVGSSTFEKIKDLISI